MRHHVMKAVPGTLLFRTWDEGLRLFRQVARHVEFHAICVMPDHVHVSTVRSDQAPAIDVAAQAYAQERNRRRRTSGKVFAPSGPPRDVADAGHLDTLRHYIHLNPVAEKLVDDPLAWPLSTYRDLCGLAFPQVCRTVRDPARFHAEGSTDTKLGLTGSPMPVPAADPRGRPATLAEVRAAVSALTRSTASDLRRPGSPRTLLLRAARQLTRSPVAEIAAFAGVGLATAYRHTSVPKAQLDLLRTVLADPRFPLLHDGDLRQSPSWSFYRAYR